MAEAADTGRFRRIERLFEAALAQPAAERDAWLCATEPDPALREDVRGLLAADAHAGGAIERTLEVAAKDLLAPRGDAPADGIDGWRLGPRLGAGGMGEVHLARPVGAEGPPVAIKLLREGVDAALLADRFEAERRILATLSHPGIARPVSYTHLDVYKRQSTYTVYLYSNNFLLACVAATQRTDKSELLTLTK